MLSMGGPVCQSCGVPMSLDERGGGTEVDGTRTREYCSHCYARGQFVHPIITMPQMIQKVNARLLDLHVSPGSVAKITGALPSLKRWRPKPPEEGPTAPSP